MNNQDAIMPKRTRVTTIQAITFFIGMAMLGTGFAKVYLIGVSIETMGLSAGALGWFLATLLLDPVARTDLFGSRFECTE